MVVVVMVGERSKMYPRGVQTSILEGITKHRWQDRDANTAIRHRCVKSPPHLLTIDKDP